MGWSFRKSINLGGGMRINLSKSGIGVSGGVKGARVSVGPRATRVYGGWGPFRYQKQVGPGLAGPRAGASGTRRWVGVIMFIIVVVIAAVSWFHSTH